MSHLRRRLTTTATALAIALAALAPTFSAHAVLAGYTTFRTVYTYDLATGAYADRTLQAGNATANDLPLGGDQGGDTIYFGSDVRFENAVLAVGTGTAGGGTIRWEYWNGATFMPLSGVSQTWAASGSFPINFTAPSDWAKTAVNGANRYWIRAAWILPRAGGSVEPLLTQATTLLLNYRLTVRDEFGGGIAGLQDLNLFLSNCSDTSVYKVKDYGTGLYELALLVSGADTTCDLRLEQTNYAPSATISTGALSASVQQDSGVITMSYLVSASQSTASANPGTVPADNATPSQITVTVKNWNNAPLAGRAVTLSSDHAGDTVTGSPATTNASGVAAFSVKSSNAGTAQYTATAAGTAISQKATVVYTAAAPTPDATAPTVGALAPTGVTANIATTISASYSDNVGIAGCDLLLDGSNVGAMALSAPGGTSGTASRSTTLSAGNHTARASCRDAAGNNGQGPSVTIVASAAPAPDTAAPTVGSISPASVTAGATVTYNAAYADTIGVTACDLIVNGANNGAMALSAPGGAAGTASKTIAFPSGNYMLRASCRDAAGNIGEGANTSVVATTGPAADITPPTVGAVSPLTATAGVAQSYTATYTDNVGVSECSLYADGVALGTTLSGGIAQTSYSFAAAGSHTMQLKCYDAAGNLGAGPTVAVTVTSAASPPTSGGRLIKLSCPAGAGVNDPCRAVYYVGAQGKRHAFPNSKVYFTWYADFSSVEVVTADELSSHPLGKNVTYRPGVRLVKFQTLAKTYAVARGGTLRWITSEDVARSLYGADWNRKVDDISDAFYLNYSFSTDIVSTDQYNQAAETAIATSIDLNF